MKICFCACVSSERIDKFLSTALKIGRKKAVKLIENRLVKVNGFIAEKFIGELFNPLYIKTK
jgi:RNA-binding protein YlmH